MFPYVMASFGVRVVVARRALVAARSDGPSAPMTPGVPPAAANWTMNSATLD